MISCPNFTSRLRNCFKVSNYLKIVTVFYLSARKRKKIFEIFHRSLKAFYLPLRQALHIIVRRWNLFFRESFKIPDLRNCISPLIKHAPSSHNTHKRWFLSVCLAHPSVRILRATGATPFPRQFWARWKINGAGWSIWPLAVNQCLKIGMERIKAKRIQISARHKKITQSLENPLQDLQGRGRENIPRKLEIFFFLPHPFSWALFLRKKAIFCGQIWANFSLLPPDSSPSKYTADSLAAAVGNGENTPFYIRIIYAELYSPLKHNSSGSSSSQTWHLCCHFHLRIVLNVHTRSVLPFWGHICRRQFFLSLLLLLLLPPFFNLFNLSLKSVWGPIRMYSENERERDSYQLGRNNYCAVLELSEGIETALF